MKSWRDLVVMLLLAVGTAMAGSFLPGDETTVFVDPALESNPKKDTIETAPVKKLYGIPVASYEVHSGKVRRNENLADLLLPFGVSMQEIYKISLLSDTLIDELKIKPGNSFAFFKITDTTSVATASYFVYEKDPLNYVVIRLDSDPLEARNGTKPIEHRVMHAAGTIETSLWVSMQSIDANPMLSVELSEIFAWTIDFFGIQQGDRYNSSV